MTDQDILSKLNEIAQKLDEMDEIKQRLDKIEERINRIETSASNMDSHINFVENIYDVCKLPFSNLLNMLSWSGGEEDQQLTLPSMSIKSNKI